MTLLIYCTVYEPGHSGENIFYIDQDATTFRVFTVLYNKFNINTESAFFWKVKYRYKAKENENKDNKTKEIDIHDTADFQDIGRFVPTSEKIQDKSSLLVSLSIEIKSNNVIIQELLLVKKYGNEVACKIKHRSKANTTRKH